MSFTSLGLSEPILHAINDSCYSQPTPIQNQAIPAVLEGKDLMAAAQTGTGKTAGYVLPLLERLSHGPRVKANQIRVLILTPTRELAVQVAANIAAYSAYLPLKSGVVYGGVKINPQMMKLRSGIDLLVATPGRLIDLASQNAVKFDQLEALVLDEADRMLDMGFSEELGQIMAQLPQKRQNLLFSATFSDEIRTLARTLLNQPVQLDISPRNSTAQNIKQWVYEVDKSKKPALLSHLIRTRNWSQVLVFSKTKKGADALVRHLKSENLAAVAIHGDKSQGLRSRALKDFKTNRTRILVATDIAARGLDIDELPQVINFDLPKIASDYIHRIGRTGRSGSAGEGISLVSADEARLLAAIEALIKKNLPREVEAGFVPKHKVPLTRQTKARPKKPKKSKLKTASTKNETTRAGQNSSSEKSHQRDKTQDSDSSKGSNRTGHGRQTPPIQKRSSTKPSHSRSRHKQS